MSAHAWRRIKRPAHAQCLITAHPVPALRGPGRGPLADLWAHLPVSEPDVDRAHPASRAQANQFLGRGRATRECPPANFDTRKGRPPATVHCRSSKFGSSCESMEKDDPVGHCRGRAGSLWPRDELAGLRPFADTRWGSEWHSAVHGEF